MLEFLEWLTTVNPMHTVAREWVRVHELNYGNRYITVKIFEEAVEDELLIEMQGPLEYDERAWPEWYQVTDKGLEYYEREKALKALRR